MQALKRNHHSSNSPVTIHGDVNTKGDTAIGSNAKIIKTIKENKVLSLFGVLVGLATIIACLIEIYKLYIGK